ncbi:B12-binding domain-containing radical SAM protein [Chloroflexota bacterium]
MKVLFVWPSKDVFGFKPIGLSLLAGIARSLAWDTRLLDTTEIDFGFVDNTQSGETAKIFKPVDFSPYNLQKRKTDLRTRVMEVLEEFNPDCLAFSVLSDEFQIAGQISNIAKKAYPGLPIIWGGAYPTLNPEKTLEMDYADFICVGEGLDAFGDFLKALSGNQHPYDIPNIWAKKNQSIIKNNIRPLKQNLDELPCVDWEIYDRRQFYKPFDGKVYFGGDHMLNWGCPNHCTYCINHFYHELYNNKYTVRRYSIRRIIDELKYLKEKYDLEFFKFHDEDFLVRPLDNLRELSDAYRQEVNIPFVTETNSRSVTEERVRLLKDMNCVSISLAIETGDSNLRKNLLNRVDSEDDVVRAFSLLKDAGIRTSSFNMLAIPFETRETYQRTIELNQKANAQYPNVTFFYPFEGTKLREISIDEGFFNPEAPETIVFERDRPALHFEKLSEQELIEMRNVFVLYVKLPEEYQTFIRRSETLDAVGRELRKKLLDIYDNTVWDNDGWYADDSLKSSYLQELREIIQQENGN